MAAALTFTSEARDAMAQKAALPPGALAPKEGPAETQDQGLGPNNEQLEKQMPEVVAALRELVISYREEGIVGRRYEVRRMGLNRLLWQGNHYSRGWNADDQNWEMPTGSQLGLRNDTTEEAEAGPRYEYVTNFYQGFGLSFIAVLSQDMPTVHWYPQEPQNEADIATAKAASEIEDLLQEQNRVEQLVIKMWMCMWTDGKLGAFVRYVADGQRYGFHENPIVEAQSQKFGQDAFHCPNCGAQTPPGQLYSGMICPQCGTALSQENFEEAPSIPVPVVTGYEKIPNGQVVITPVGGLELNTPVWANELHEMPYVQWQLEVHEAKLRAAYPEAAEKILPGQPDGAEDIYARTKRLAIQQGLPTVHPGDALVSLITYTRNWIRPWAFFSHRVKKDVREKLLALFPDGCYCAFAGETYCESRNENVDEHWRIVHAMPGDGQNRPAVGDSTVSVQERYNTLSNIMQENIEYGIPPVVADAQVIDFDALATRQAEPASWLPARARAGIPLAESFYQPDAAKIAPETGQYMEELRGPVCEFLTGLFPAIYGGDMADQKTATGYSLARDQAMGRLGLYWRAFKCFWAEVMLLAVQCFCENATEDTQRAVLGEDNEYEQKVISIADLRGKIQARPEADETFPKLKSQQRGVLMNIMGLAGEAPEIAAMLNEPGNMRTIKDTLGLDDFTVPGEDSANKQAREIAQLLQSAPIKIEQPGTPGPNGEPGMPQAMLTSTVPVDPKLDRHAIEMQEIVRWANSPAGIAARMKNPAGFANVRAHYEDHERIAEQNKQNAAKPPSESINFKDMTPGGKVQMAAQAGIQLNPAELMVKEAQDRQDKQQKMEQLRNAKEKAA